VENKLFEKPSLNSPQGYPAFHSERDNTDQPALKIIGKWQA
jgi:hypothetical protein